MALEKSCRSPSTPSIRTAEPIIPISIVPASKRPAAPRLTGSRLAESWPVRSSVRIAASWIDVSTPQFFIQGFEGAVDGHFDRRFRQAGAGSGLRHRHAIQLDVFHQLA